MVMCLCKCMESLLYYHLDLGDCKTFLKNACLRCGRDAGVRTMRPPRLVSYACLYTTIVRMW